jgi:hypothetical protein
MMAWVGYRTIPAMRLSGRIRLNPGEIIVGVEVLSEDRLGVQIVRYEDEVESSGAEG